MQERAAPDGAGVSEALRTRRVWIGLAICCGLALPWSRHFMQATMTRQMLVQLPLLALAGWLLGKTLPQRISTVTAPWDRSGITGLILVSVVSIFWMLPRALDASIELPSAELAKFVTIPLLIGVPFALSWPRAGFVVRGMFLVETAATSMRLGWLYLASPQRLCANYLLDDQQRLGTLLFVIGILIGLVLLWKLVFGRIEVGSAWRRQPP